ncbi:MAG TPA: hypothetical protein VG271_13440 [Beijerinckiaceae bacterium]|jgi:hypothetical protein|nr:hypothetical protein [Beijerinckiaceae bacterium]
MKIPAARAIILWDNNEQRNAVSFVLVCDIKNQPPAARSLSCSRGACDEDWLKGDWRTTPMGVFLEISVADGLNDKPTRIAALREFAKIEEQDWAVILHRELTGEDPE